MTKSQFYIEDLTTIKQFKPSKSKVIVGIDEAGRGPVLGHLVYGALIATKVTHPFQDSKLLTAQKRNELFYRIKLHYSYIYTAIHPKFLSNEMSLKKSLNEISYSVVIDLLKEILKVYDVECVFLDALGPIETYRKRIKSFFPNLKVVIENKADSKYEIVSGASIVAKVNRDDILSNWELEDKNVGSGYPGDENTRNWMKRNFCKIFGFPNVVRFSWKTAKEFFDERNGKRLAGKFDCFCIDNE
ncbi:hypothetical protein GVAV_001782 [Gurleya vavrai]